MLFANCSSYSILGQDHQEDCAAYGVHRVQIPQADSPEALQALRAGRWQEAQGTDDPVLGTFFTPSKILFSLTKWFYVVFASLHGGK